MSPVWEYTESCAKKYRCDLSIYLIPLLLSSYGITMYRTINAPVHGKNVVDRINATE